MGRIKTRERFAVVYINKFAYVAVEDLFLTSLYLCS